MRRRTVLVVALVSIAIGVALLVGGAQAPAPVPERLQLRQLA